MPGQPPTMQRILFASVASLTIGLGAVTVVTGLSDSVPVRLLQGLAVFFAGAAIIGGAVVLVMTHMAGWRGEGGDPQSEEEFEAIVERAERLAAGGYDGPGQPYDDARYGLSEDRDDDDDEYAVSGDDDFRALVRSAIDELPLEFHRALEHVAIVVSDGGRARGAYGLYQGDTVARDFFHDRIVIFRDTLMRDFGHDPELLKAQVTRTVRHELAHHLGWGERGVRGLGL
jgi:predicted Zn-dependent protease with MMP-like domain